MYTFIFVLFNMFEHPVYTTFKFHGASYIKPCNFLLQSFVFCQQRGASVDVAPSPIRASPLPVSVNGAGTMAGAGASWLWARRASTARQRCRTSSWCRRRRDATAAPSAASAGTTAVRNAAIAASPAASKMFPPSAPVVCYIGFGYNLCETIQAWRRRCSTLAGI